jgi:hypothetical protein
LKFAEAAAHPLGSADEAARVRDALGVQAPDPAALWR